MIMALHFGQNVELDRAPLAVGDSQMRHLLEVFLDEVRSQPEVVGGYLKNNFLIFTLKKAKMAEYLEETLEQLIGNAKLSNDFVSQKYKVRYSASPTIVPGK